MSESNLPMIPEAPITDLAQLESLAGQFLPATSDPDFADEMGLGGGYLPYIVLVQGQSPLAAPPHEIPQGNFVLKSGKTDVENLGRSFDVFICDHRPKAMYSDKVAGKITSIHDRNDPRFKDFQACANAKERGYFWGIEFLLYLGETGNYVTMFCNNPTLRRSGSTELVPRRHKPVTIKAAPVSNEEYSWWAFEAKACSTPFSVPVDLGLMRSQIEKFQDTSVFEEEHEETNPVTETGGAERER